MGTVDGIGVDMRENLLNTWYAQCGYKGFSLTMVKTNTKSPPRAEPLVEQGTGVDHDFMASISNNTTIMGCNDKERHNSIYEPRNNQQHHNGYYIVDKTVQHGQSVEMDMKIHLADKAPYAEERGPSEW